MAFAFANALPAIESTLARQGLSGYEIPVHTIRNPRYEIRDTRYVTVYRRPHIQYISYHRGKGLGLDAAPEGTSSSSSNTYYICKYVGTLTLARVSPILTVIDPIRSFTVHTVTNTHMDCHILIGKRVDRRVFSADTPSIRAVLGSWMEGGRMHIRAAARI